MTDIVKNSLLATNIIADPINGTSLIRLKMKFKYAVVMHSVMYSLRFGNLDNYALSETTNYDNIDGPGPIMFS